MNFTSDIKKEIISRGIGAKRGGLAEKKAGLSAFVRTCGTMGFKDGVPTFFLVSETENVTEFFINLFLETFGFELYISSATMDRMSGRDKLLLQCPAANSETVLKELGLLKRTGGFKEGISSKLVSDDEKKIAYLRGAFLGGGSCTLPSEEGKTGYHLEIVFPEREVAMDFCDILTDFELIAKLVERKETYVVYIKSKELISDFLAVIGAESCLKKFSAFVEKRDEANRKNRARNCISGNADKAAIASVNQVMAIRKLAEHENWKELSDDLKTLARERLKNPSMSLQELADYLGVSKSCLNHRMRKLMETAKELND
ncbi:MAG: DNA-binding protein WhiA [Clostridiales bacterium]|nr:DNA-binding protein WhiA [Clostridiales bacterium]